MMWRFLNQISPFQKAYPETQNFYSERTLERLVIGNLTGSTNPGGHSSKKPLQGSRLGGLISWQQNHDFVISPGESPMPSLQHRVKLNELAS